MNKFGDIYTAAETGDLEMLEEIISRHPEKINEPGSNGLTALAAALYSGQSDALHLLLNHGASKHAEGKDGKPVLQWASDQEDNETASTLMAWDYIDRLYETSLWWAAAKAEEAVCDSCAASINPDNSLIMTIDEVFTSGKYSEQIINQALKLKPPEIRNKNREDLLDYIKKIIKESSKSDKYIVCTNCVERFFSPVIFGNSRDFITETVDSMLRDEENDSPGEDTT